MAVPGVVPLKNFLSGPGTNSPENSRHLHRLKGLALAHRLRVVLDTTKNRRTQGITKTGSIALAYFRFPFGAEYETQFLEC